jgi:hypothetical protein
MTRPSLLAFKQKMVHRLTGKSAVSASQLARETGVRQQNLSRLAGEARSLPLMNDTSKRAVRQWMVEQKARVLAEASNLDGNEVTGVVIDASGAICGLGSQVGRSVALTPRPVALINGSSLASAIRRVTIEHRRHALRQSNVAPSFGDHHVAESTGIGNRRIRFIATRLRPTRVE